VKVAAVQHDIMWEDPSATQRRVAPMIAAAAGAGARLVVLAEMYATGFSMAAERIAEPPDGPSTAFLQDQAITHGVWVCASVPTRDRAVRRPVNRLVLAHPDGQIDHYDKIHPFTYAGEHEHYAAGDAFLTVDVEGTRCSFFVCYDLRFADELWQLAGVTDCFVVPANWPEPRRAHWQTLLSARAIENQAYVVGVNRVGEGGGLSYAGDSRIIDPLGEVLASGSRTEALLVAEVDAAVVADVRARFPFLQDRRTHPVGRRPAAAGPVPSRPARGEQ
jgi:predicted amidohydrolase